MKKTIALIVTVLTILSSKVAFADSGVVNTASLCVRQKPSLTASVTGFLSKNTKINTLGKEGDFYKINYGGKIGYVHKTYVNLVKSTTTDKNVATVKPCYIEKYGVITASVLNLRAGAGSTYPVTGVIKFGSEVIILENENGFCKVIYLGKTSYVSAIYVKITGQKTVYTNSTSSSTTVALAPVLLEESTAEYIEAGQQYDTKTTGDELVSYSNKFLGTPYLGGGATPAKFNATGEYLSGGFDCSGFVQYSYKNFGINLPRTTMEQVNKGVSVNINNLENGDLVFFTTNSLAPSQISHVGIYIGNNKFMHSSKPGDVIKTSELTGYYEDNFVIGKRIIS